MAIIPAFPYTLTNGTTADANQVMADLNNILTGVNTNGAANGPNSDITSLTGLTTPLSVSQGGTGANNAAGALVDLGAAPTASPTFTGTVTAAAITASGAVNLNGAPNNIKGVTDNSSAAAGYVGEYVAATVGPQAFSNGVTGNAGSMALSAGDWDVWAVHTFTLSASATAITAGVSTVSGTLQTTASIAVPGLGSQNMATPRVRMSSASAITVFAVGNVSFSSGTCNVTSNIFARRMR